MTPTHSYTLRQHAAYLLNDDPFLLPEWHDVIRKDVLKLSLVTYDELLDKPVRDLTTNQLQLLSDKMKTFFPPELHELDTLNIPPNKGVREFLGMMQSSFLTHY